MVVRTIYVAYDPNNVFSSTSNKLTEFGAVCAFAKKKVRNNQLLDNRLLVNVSMHGYMRYLMHLVDT